jgi:hypothetical protein
MLKIKIFLKVYDSTLMEISLFLLLIPFWKTGVLTKVTLKFGSAVSSGGQGNVTFHILLLASDRDGTVNLRIFRSFHRIAKSDY